LEIIRRPLPWLVGGVLIGLGFVSAFSGGVVLLVAGLAIGLFLFFRRRGRRQGWPALLYGAGITTAVFLLPYVFQPAACVASQGAGCYQGFTIGTFVVSLLVALAGLAFSIQEVRRRPGP
jgi:hypothetical protein